MGLCTSCLGRRERQDDSSSWDQVDLPQILPTVEDTKLTITTGRGTLRGEDEEEEEFELVTFKTMLEFRTRYSRNKQRSRSAPPKLLGHQQISPEKMRGLEMVRSAEQRVIEPEHRQEDVEAKAVHLLSHPSDDQFEPPPLTFELFAGITAARRLRIWRTLPERPHACGNTCAACCSLYNTEWRLASMCHIPVGRQPGDPPLCKDLEVFDDVPEHDVYRGIA
ncbi:unnamed protein product [Symbiodinium pilosum]|uniref:Uncharacterized protein n=1 Tax=Symbiodinium pilosum TaxID=2952 RepID=A0A812Q3Q0_SYMPI|nr:unnamed protein product [Symbiodinium pilosum]